MTGIDPEAANIRRLVVKLLLARVDTEGAPEAVLDEVRAEGLDTAIGVLRDIADLAATTLVQQHGVADAEATLNRLIAADLEEEVLPPTP